MLLPSARPAPASHEGRWKFSRVDGVGNRLSLAYVVVPIHRVADMPCICHSYAMTRVRVSTTVDEDLLTRAREVLGVNDAALLDEALTALLATHREAEIDASYAAYDEYPLDEPDEWGDLATWRDSAGRA